MNFATLFRMKGTPWLCEYAPTEPISCCSSFARAKTSFGKMSGASSASAGHSSSATTYTNESTPSQHPIAPVGRRTYLPRERYRWLVEPLLLWVPDVGADDLVKGQAMVVLVELLAVVLGLDCELAADGVLDGEDGGVEGRGCEGAHGY